MQMRFTWKTASFPIALAVLAWSVASAQSAIKTISSLSAGDFLKCETPDLPPDDIISYCAAMMRANIPIDPNYRQYHYPRRSSMANYALHTGLAFLRKGQDDFARKYFVFAIGVITEQLKPFPNDPTLLGERCWVRAVINSELEEATKDCDRAILAKPEDNELLRNKGFVLLRQEKYQDALASFDASLQRKDDDSYALYLRGLTKQKLGDANADADVQSATKINSAIAAIFKNYGVN
jgi:tetratricopeptide (TPR) repeat protein